MPTSLDHTFMLSLTDRVQLVRDALEILRVSLAEEFGETDHRVLEIDEAYGLLDGVLRGFEENSRRNPEAEVRFPITAKFDRA